MSQSKFNVIDTKVGLLGGTVLLIGNVIAMTVFLLPAHLLADEGVGPSIAIAMVLVSLPVAVGILGLLQVGGAMPAAGGTYVYASRLIHPFFGFLLPWVTVPIVWFGQIYLAYGFAEFVRFFEVLTVGNVVLFSDVPLWLLMYAVLVPFIALNVLGIRMVAQVQLVLVAIIIGGMLAFVVPGSMAVDTGNYTPLYPADGIEPFVTAMISLSIALHGFNVVTDLGEELKNPVTNIPRVLGLGAFVSIALMVAVVVIAVGVVDWTYYVQGGEALPAGVAVAAGEFLPPWGAALVAIAAVVGAFTSINTLYTSYSRQVMRAARDETIPLSFAKIHSRFGTPHRAIYLVGLPALALVLVYTPLVPIENPSPVPISVGVAMAALFGSTVSAFALWNLPKRYPDRYEYSLYKLPLPLLKGIAISGFVVNGLFLLLVTYSEPLLAGGLAVWILLAIPAFRLRVRQIGAKGIDLPTRMQHLHDHERDDGGQRSTPTSGDSTDSAANASGTGIDD